MSRIQVDNIFDKEGNGAPSLPAGAVVTGVTTSTSFDGNLTGTTVSVTDSVSIGGTSVMTAIDGKTSPGKAIALSMVFG
jgi:hypothetical protein